MATAVEQLREDEHAVEAPVVDRAAVDAAAAELAEVSDFDAAAEDASGQFVLVLGGKAPTTEALRLYGGAIECSPPEGGWDKGASYTLRVEVTCHKVSFTDERDGKTGDVVGCRQEAGLKITGVKLAR